MKKRTIITCILISLVMPYGFLVAGGGDSFAGGLAGGVAGGLLSSAITSGGSSSAKREALKAREEAEMLRHEREKMRLDTARRGLDRQGALQAANQKGGMQGPLFYLLLFFILVLIVGIGVMGVMLFKKPKSRN